MTATVALIIFSLASSSTLFLWKGYRHANMTTEVMMAAREISDYLTEDIRGSRIIETVAEGWIFTGRYGEKAVYQLSRRRLNRNGLRIGTDIRIDSLDVISLSDIKSDTIPGRSLVEFTLVVRHAADSTIVHRPRVVSLMRLAPKWPTVAEESSR